MKKLTFIFAALAAAFAVSCTKEAPVADVDAPAAVGMKTVTITASIDDLDTKTSYDADGKFSWTKGDQISVLCSENGTKKFYTFTAQATGASVAFSGLLPETAELAYDKYAFYPADENHEFVPGVEGATDGTQYSSYYYNVPEYMDLSEVPSAGLPMGAGSPEGYVFKHMTGAALFKFTNVPDEFDAVEISFSQALKFNGKFKTYLSDGVWSYFSAANATKGTPEASYTRKVKVENNTAKVYLPYPNATLWSGLTITVKAMTSDGTEVTLLSDLKTKQDIAAMPKATIVPMAEVELPAYLPPVDWTKVDWTGENVATVVNDASATADSRMKELKAVADKYYMYVSLTATKEAPFGANYLDFFLTDGEGETKVWSGWTTTGTDVYYQEHKCELNESGELTKMRWYVGSDRVYINDYVTAFTDTEVIWTMAFPRSYVDVYRASTGKVYLSFLLWNGWSDYWAIPARENAMHEDTLP